MKIQPVNLRTPSGMRTARKAMQLSVRKFADHTGTSPRSITAYEAGETAVPKYIAKLVAYVIKEAGLWPLRAPILRAPVPNSETSPDQP